MLCCTDSFSHLLFADSAIQMARDSSVASSNIWSIVDLPVLRSWPQHTSTKSLPKFSGLVIAGCHLSICKLCSLRPPQGNLWLPSPAWTSRSLAADRVRRSRIFTGLILSSATASTDLLGRRVVRGLADHSHAARCAELCGLPQAVVGRAEHFR